MHIENIIILPAYKENHLFQTSMDVSCLRFAILCLVASVRRHWHVWYSRRCLYTDMCPFSRAKLSALLFCLFAVQTSNPLSRRICKKFNIVKPSIILVKKIPWGKWVYFDALPANNEDVLPALQDVLPCCPTRHMADKMAGRSRGRV